MQAYRRNIDVGNLPELILPHGNSGVGLCNDCKVKGNTGCLCRNCFKVLEQMPLLYPTGKNRNMIGNGFSIDRKWVTAYVRVNKDGKERLQS